ncbi:MAG: hypothetical protein ACLVD8_25745 [Enterocloster sp.]|uniref:hypothetical protein n=1 Tax=Enterocloster sp. TaxID=2719315 RepID=UPI003999D1C7
MLRYCLESWQASKQSCRLILKAEQLCSKAQKSIRRFSEDIDLTVCIDNCSNNQAKKRLELATKKYQSLPRTSRKELEDDRKGSITAVYDYAPLVGIDSDDPLQRFGYVKVEGTSFHCQRTLYSTLKLNRYFILMPQKNNAKSFKRNMMLTFPDQYNSAWSVFLQTKFLQLSFIMNVKCILMWQTSL